MSLNALFLQSPRQLFQQVFSSSVKPFKPTQNQPLTPKFLLLLGNANHVASWTSPLKQLIPLTTTDGSNDEKRCRKASQKKFFFPLQQREGRCN